MTQTRPTYSGLPAKAMWGVTITLTVSLPPNTLKVTASLLDYGFSTHSVHMDMR